MNRNDVFYIGQEAFVKTAELRKGSCAGCAGYVRGVVCKFVRLYNDRCIPEGYRVYPCAARGNVTEIKNMFKAARIA